MHQTFKGFNIDYYSMKAQKLLRLVSEMLKNSKKSDRELAGILGVSQPTVSRTRARIFDCRARERQR